MLIIFIMDKITFNDSVIISLALRAQIRSYVKIIKDSLDCGLDVSFFVSSLNDLIHAYNSVNVSPYVLEDEFVSSLLKL